MHHYARAAGRARQSYSITSSAASVAYACHARAPAPLRRGLEFAKEEKSSFIRSEEVVEATITVNPRGY